MSMFVGILAGTVTATLLWDLNFGQALAVFFAAFAISGLALQCYAVMHRRRQM